MQQELRATKDPVRRLILARNMALFTVAFSTTKRGDELTRTLTQRILRLPDRSGFMSNFQWGKTMRGRSGAFDHDPARREPLGDVPGEGSRDSQGTHRGLTGAAVGTYAGWDNTQGYLFPHILAGEGGVLQ